MTTAKETILKEETVLYATTFPAGTIIYEHQTSDSSKVVCSIKILAPQKILDQCVVQMQLTGSTVLFPANTTFQYKIEKGRVEYASENVPTSVELQEVLNIAGFSIPASSTVAFLTNTNQASLGEGEDLENLQANDFRATLFITLKETITLGKTALPKETHLYLTGKELSWSYFGEDTNQNKMNKQGVLMNFKAHVERVLEEKNLDTIEYEALHYLSTSYFKENIEWASTLLGHYYKDQEETALAAKYYHQAYRTVVEVEEPNREKAYQLDYWISKLKLGSSITEKKHSLRKFYMFNIFLFVVLFYAGVHLNEEEKAFLAGLRPKQDSYDWATSFYAVLSLVCSLFAIYVGVRTLSTMRRIGVAVGLLSVVGFIYSMVVLVYAETMRMEDVLLVYGPYIVLGVWLNAYVMMMRDRDFLEEEG
jgi:hypothetical protein